MIMIIILVKFSLRVAEQLQFPHDEQRDDPLKVQTAEERAKEFTVGNFLHKHSIFIIFCFSQERNWNNGSMRF